MHAVSDLFPQPETARTKVWATALGQKEYADIKHPKQAALFQIRADKGFEGFKGDALRREGDGIWAFGSSAFTTRIAGFFDNELSRRVFVVCGVWDGKPGRGGGRPARGDTVTARAEQVKRDGVKYVQSQTQAGTGTSGGIEGGSG